MAANILRSERAVQMSVFVVRAFVRLREQVAANTAILKRLAEIDKTLVQHDAALSDLYRKLLRTLSGGTGRRGDGKPYVERLVAVHLLGPDMSPDQAANAYFERVLDRPLYLARRAHHHKGHDVLLALCRRGVDARWKAADLGRSPTPLGEAGLRDLRTPNTLHDCRGSTMMKRYKRDHNPIWLDNNCSEDNRHVWIGDEHYVLSGDGLLMPSKKDQAPPDLRYFKQAPQ